MNDRRPLVLHLVYSFDVGGLENGIVNLINRMDPGRFRHMVVALTRCESSFCQRVKRPDVGFMSLHKPPGHGYKLYPTLYRLFKDQRPAILHTRNLAALEAVVPARAAGVPVRIHGEHGWDVSDPGGTRHKFRLMRRLYKPFVSHYIALSGQIARYLELGVGVPEARLSRICNGVDTARFHPAGGGGRTMLPGSPFNASGLLIVGTVGRLQAVKDQLTLVQAFAHARTLLGSAAAPLRLIIAGDGPLRGEVDAAIDAAGVREQVWLAGNRADVPDVMRALDLFVLPSRAEGISNTILEAMASGLPVIATQVGGNDELVTSETGRLVPAIEPRIMGEEIARYAADLQLRNAQGHAGRLRVEADFSLDGMVERYTTLYQLQLDAAGALRPAA